MAIKSCDQGVLWAMDRPRIEGFDLARAVAVMVMIVVNYTALMQIGTFSPLWLNRSIDFLFGRAATVFVILAGVSISLLSAGKSPDEMRRFLLARSLLLFVIGMALWHWWAADILHFYAAYMALGACLIAWPGCRLYRLGIIIGLISLPVCAGLTVAYDGADPIAFFDGHGLGLRLAADYLLGCYYPFFPWFGYFVMGMLLGRREPTGRSVHRRLLLVSAVSCLVIEVFSGSMLTWVQRRDMEIEGCWWLTFLRSEAFPVTPLFVISSAASALALISLCRLVAEHPSFACLLKPLSQFGKLSLTMYVAHLLWGFGVTSWIESFGTKVGPFQMVVSAGVFAIAGICFALLWCRRFRRGPLETLFYRLSHIKWPRTAHMASLPKV